MTLIIDGSLTRCAMVKISNLICRQRETGRDRERQGETERDRERQLETERDSISLLHLDSGSGEVWINHKFSSSQKLPERN